MIHYFQNIRSNPLFEGITDGELKVLLNCIGASEHTYEKGDFIFLEGDAPKYVGMVIGGAVHVVREDFWGGRTIMTRVEAGGLFGEAFACAGLRALPISVEAMEKCEVLLMDGKKIMGSCHQACGFHAVLMQNMVRTIAKKNIQLMRKIQHVTRKTTREKLLSYLSQQAALKRSDAFDIPFSRQELAEYLAVDRSAMSTEISKMQKDGLMKVERNHFELIKGQS